MADYFEACLETGKPEGVPLENRAKLVSNWMLGDFSRLLNASNIDIADSRVTPDRLCELLSLVSRGTISGPAAKQVWEEMFNSGKSPAEIVAQKGLNQISNADELENAIEQIMTENPQAVSDFKAGKDTALKFLVGQLMRATKGRANPQMANQLFRKKLEEK